MTLLYIMRLTIVFAAVVSLAAVQGSPPVQRPDPPDSAAFLQAQFTPLPPLSAADARRIDELLRQMTPAEKVGQMTQLEIGMVTDGKDLDLRINPDKLQVTVI